MRAHLRPLLLPVLVLSTGCLETMGTISPPSEPADLSALTATVEALQQSNVELLSRIEALEAENASLTGRLDVVEPEVVSGLASLVTVTTDAQGHPTIVFSGVNVHVNNGDGTTDTVNGLGNLVVGYDEPRIDGVPVCSHGQYRDQQSCEANGLVWTDNHKSGSHNLIVGSEHSYSQFGSTLLGQENTVNNAFATITGGRLNLALGTNSSVTGGSGNLASGFFATVTAGFGNEANGLLAAIHGGTDNVAVGTYSTITGGDTNETSGQSSSVSGGENNTVSGRGGSISGGERNVVLGRSGTVTGGVYNEAHGELSTISGGYEATTTDFFDGRAGSLFEEE
ncbi:MAG: hypothetical protein AAGA48_08705 [Myxococcota bacterium]